MMRNHRNLREERPFISGNLYAEGRVMRDRGEAMR